MFMGRALIGLSLGIAAIALALVGTAPTSDAQQAAKRTILQKAELADLDQREGLIITGEIPPGAETGRHTHPGTELGYLLEGSIVLEVEGTSPRTYKAGATWILAPGQVHNAKGSGDTTARTLVVYIVEKGKPLASPAP
jgi:quercetin dioxygenase-like cupin family protein